MGCWRTLKSYHCKRICYNFLPPQVVGTQKLQANSKGLGKMVFAVLPQLVQFLVHFIVSTLVLFIKTINTCY